MDRAARPLRSIWDLYIRTACYDPPGVRIGDLRGSARVLGHSIPSVTWATAAAAAAVGAAEGATEAL